MSFSQALNTSLSGLRATQAGLSLIAANVANAQTPGYVRKTHAARHVDGERPAAAFASSAINRELDQYLQRQLRVETAGGAYADSARAILSAAAGILRRPRLRQLARDGVQQLHRLRAVAGDEPGFDRRAQPRAQQRAGAGADAQQRDRRHPGAARRRRERPRRLRSRAANDAMQQIADSTSSSPASAITSASDAALADQRDNYIDQLSQLMDIRVVTDDQNQVTVFTNSGIQLVGADAAQLSFNAQGTVTRDDAVERRSDQKHPRHADAGVADRRLGRSDRQPLDPLRQDRRLSRHARQRAGAGAEPARQPRRRDGAGAVERHHRRRHRHVRRAERLFRRHRGTAERQPHQSDLHRHR